MQMRLVVRFCCGNWSGEGRWAEDELELAEEESDSFKREGKGSARGASLPDRHSATTVHSEGPNEESSDDSAGGQRDDWLPLLVRAPLVSGPLFALWPG